MNSPTARPRAMIAATIAIFALASGCNLKAFFGDPRCYTTADCSGGQVCSADLCVGPGSLGTGRKCWATRDCLPTQTCQEVPIQPDGGAQELTQLCLPAGMGVVGGDCKTSLDCTNGLRCALVGFTGTCEMAGPTDRGGACTSTADCLAGLACGPDHPDGGTSSGMVCAPYTEAFPPFVGVTCPTQSGPFVAHFEVPRPGKPPVDFFRQPFPSDVRVDTSGHLDMSDFPRPGPTPLGIDLVGLYVDALVADFDGFSAVAPITFRYSAAVDAATLVSAVTFVDVTTGTDFATAHPAIATAHAARTKYSCEDRVVVEHAAGDVLQPRHTYAVMLRGLTSRGGAAAQDPDFAALLASTRPAPSGSDDALGHAWDVYAPLRTWLTQKGTDAASVDVATVFTTGDATATVGKIHDAVAAAPAPVLSDLTLCDTGVTAPCADGGPQRVCGAADPNFYEIQGRMTFPIFQSGTEPYLNPDDGGGITLGAPTVVRTESVCVAFTVPKQPAPLGGWPLVVFSHGTGGSYRDFIDSRIALQLSTGTNFLAAMSFDAVEHGSRKGGSMVSSDDLVFNVLNPRAARDNTLQGAADVLTALRSAGLTLPATLTGSVVTFDPSHVVYFGHSQGGNAGHLGLSYATNVHAAVLSGSGGGVADGLLTKTAPIDIATGMQILLGEALDRSHPAMLVFQTYFDRSDPQVYAPLLIRRPPPGVPAKHVLHTFGLGDTYAPPLTLGNITKALGVPLVSPVLQAVDDPVVATVPSIDRPVIGNLTGGDGQEITGATFQYDPMMAYDGHFVAMEDPQAIIDWKYFFVSYVLAGTPHVP